MSNGGSTASDKGNSGTSALCVSWRSPETVRAVGGLGVVTFVMLVPRMTSVEAIASGLSETSLRMRMYD